MSVHKGTANPSSKSLFPTYTENEKNMVIKKKLQKRGSFRCIDDAAVARVIMNGALSLNTLLSIEVQD